MLNFLIKLLFSFLLTTNFYTFNKNENYAGQETQINAHNQNGEKEGKWKYYGKDLPEYKYNDDILVWEGYYKTGKREGEWIHYFKDGKTPLLIANYKSNRPSGNYERFNKEGVLIESGEMRDGKYTGILSMFYDDGSPRFKGDFYRGHENGDIVQYDKLGNILLAYTSFNDVINKRSITNAAKNKEHLKTRQTLVYPNETTRNASESAPIVNNPNVRGGVFDPNGYNKIYNDQNDILQDGTFRSGKLFDGKLYQYDNDGILFKVKVFKNGVYVSDGQI